MTGKKIRSSQNVTDVSFFCSADNTYCIIQFDGSRKLKGLGAGVIFTSLRGDKFYYVLRLMFCCTNNAAEYEALLHGLRISKAI